MTLSPDRLQQMRDCAVAAGAEYDRQAAEGTLYQPSRPFWDASLPTYIENWPLELHAMSIPSIVVRLSFDEARTLGSHNGDWGVTFEAPPDHQALKAAMIAKWDEKLRLFPRGAFIRLGSRSPKDGLYWGVNAQDHPGGRVRSGEEAWRRMTACSERIYEDLQMQLQMKYEPRIVFREWIDMPEWSEFRCFQHGAQLVGISQYFHRGVYPEVIKDAAGLKWAIEQFHEHVFRPAIKDNQSLQDVVFDVFVKKLKFSTITRWEVKLVEINPFGPLTDPCLFDWNRLEFRGQLRYRKEFGPRDTCTKEV